MRCNNPLALRKKSSSGELLFHRTSCKTNGTAYRLCRYKHEVEVLSALRSKFLEKAKKAFLLTFFASEKSKNPLSNLHAGFMQP